MIDGSRIRQRMCGRVLLGAWVMLASAGVGAQCLPEFKDGWIRIPPPGGMGMAAGFGQFHNGCAQPFQVTAAKSSAFADVSIHETTQTNGVSRMRAVPEPGIAGRQVGAACTGRPASDADGSACAAAGRRAGAGDLYLAGWPRGQDHAAGAQARAGFVNARNARLSGVWVLQCLPSPLRDIADQTRCVVASRLPLHCVGLYHAACRWYRAAA